MREIVSELREDGPTEAEVERARAFAAGARAIAFENSGAVARYAAQQTIVYGEEDLDPDSSIANLDRVTFDEVRSVAAGVADRLSIACVGPHTVEELELA
jgi:predicted Zn-dependent peptidase